VREALVPRRRGLSLSLLLVVVGAVLLAVGVGVTVGAVTEPLIGCGVAVSIFGVELVLVGLFAIPASIPVGDRRGGL
jgi:hypothetical protein